MYINSQLYNENASWLAVVCRKLLCFIFLNVLCHI